MMVLRTVGLLTDNAGSPWVQDAVPILREVIALHQEIAEWFELQLEMD